MHNIITILTTKRSRPRHIQYMHIITHSTTLYKDNCEPSSYLLCSLWTAMCQHWSRNWLYFRGTLVQLRFLGGGGSCFIFCVVFCSVWPFSFSHCVVCRSSIYGFWLPLWYLKFVFYASNTAIILVWKWRREELLFKSWICVLFLLLNFWHYLITLKGAVVAVIVW